MPITLKQTNTAPITNATWPSPYTLTLPGSYVTAAGDVIVLAIGQNGSPTPDPVVTGCGCKWTVSPHQGTGHLIIGVGATAGGTTLSITGLNTGAGGDIVVGVFGGAGAAVGAFVSTAALHTATTAPPLAYPQNALVLGAGSSISPWAASSWSNAGTNHHAFDSDTNYGAWLDYQLPSGPGATEYSTNISVNNTVTAIMAAVYFADSMLLVL